MFSSKIDDECELRLIEPADAEALSALINENFEHIREWSGWLNEKQRPIGRTREWIDENRFRFAGGSGFEMAIWHRGKMAGQIGYNYFDRENRRTELGYWLAASFQGKGLVTKSCRALITNAFETLNMNRVEIRCGAKNLKSRKIPENLGFKKEGTARQAEWLHDRFIDLVVYSMLANDWKDRASRIVLR